MHFFCPLLCKNPNIYCRAEKNEKKRRVKDELRTIPTSNSFFDQSITRLMTYALFEEPNSRILPFTVSLMASRAGPKYFRGS